MTYSEHQPKESEALNSLAQRAGESIETPCTKPNLNSEAIKKFADHSFTLLIAMEKALRTNAMPVTADLLRTYIDFVNNYGNEKT